MRNALFSILLICLLSIYFVQAAPTWCGFHTIHTTIDGGTMTLAQRTAEMKEHFDCGSTNEHDGGLDQSEWNMLLNEANSNNQDNNFTYFFGVEWSSSQQLHWISLNPPASPKKYTDADFDTKSPCLALALETGTGSKKVLVHGVLKTSNWNWTIGNGKANLVYISTATGALIQHAGMLAGVTGEDDVIQPVGWALASNCIYFSPSMIYLTHAA